MIKVGIRRTRAALRCESRAARAHCLHLLARAEAAAGNGSAAEALFGRAAATFESLAARTTHAGSPPTKRCCISPKAGWPTGQLVEKINADLEAGLSLAASDDVLSPRFACHRVWAATGDPRAAEAVNTAHAELQALVAKAGDEDTRLSVLENVSLHREIIAAWAAQQAGSDKTLSGHC